MDTPTAITPSPGEIIASVSTRQRGKPRWTELTIAYAPAADQRCFIAEVAGHSTMQGETTKRRSVRVSSVERALELFDQDSDATQNVRVEALDWWDRNGERVKADVLRLRQIERGEFGYQGTTLLQAIAWLYGDAQAGKAQRLADDFGVPRRTVAHALDQEQSGQPLTGWQKAFISSLRYFDRDAFQKDRANAQTPS
jgi:hypothetical protein